MINYSVYMKGNPIYPELPEKAYAKNQVSEVWTLEKFSKHIADHNGVYSHSTVKGVLSDMCECLVEQLLNGNKVQIGELSTFGISLSSEEELTAKNIKAVNILFFPDPDFENLIGHAEFNVVSSRAAQPATLKVEKADEDTVNLQVAKTKGVSSNESGREGEKMPPAGSGD